MARIHAASFARGWSEAEIAALLARTTTLAVHGPHGFALLQCVPPEAEILTIAVTPEARGEGHGTRLLARSLAAAAQAGATRITLEVDATNAPALALYAAAGFAEIARRKGYYAHPGGPRTDALVLARALPSDTGAT
jgi:ribosomal-protein-alanine N-acetyltransferase